MLVLVPAALGFAVENFRIWPPVVWEGGTIRSEVTLRDGEDTGWEAPTGDTGLPCDYADTGRRGGAHVHLGMGREQRPG